MKIRLLKHIHILNISFSKPYSKKPVSSSKQSSSAVSSTPATSSASSSNKPSKVTLASLKATKIIYPWDGKPDTKLAFVNNNNFTSATDYLIWVSESDFKVNLFERDKTSGKWDLLKVSTCDIGDASKGDATVEGFFQTEHNGKLPSFTSTSFTGDPIIVYWAIRFYPHYYLHSVEYKYTPKVTPTTYSPTKSILYDGTLGAAVSHGCVRQSEEDAKYLYDLIPEYTTVYIK